MFGFRFGNEQARKAGGVGAAPVLSKGWGS